MAALIDGKRNADHLSETMNQPKRARQDMVSYTPSEKSISIQGVSIQINSFVCLCHLVCKSAAFFLCSQKLHFHTLPKIDSCYELCMLKFNQYISFIDRFSLEIQSVYKSATSFLAVQFDYSFLYNVNNVTNQDQNTKLKCS